MGSAADGDAGLGAPEADLGVVHMVEGAAFPAGEGGGKWGGVGVAGGGV